DDGEDGGRGGPGVAGLDGADDGAVHRQGGLHRTGGPGADVETVLQRDVDGAAERAEETVAAGVQQGPVEGDVGLDVAVPVRFGRLGLHGGQGVVQDAYVLRAGPLGGEPGRLRLDDPAQFGRVA